MQPRPGPEERKRGEPEWRKPPGVKHSTVTKIQTAQNISAVPGQFIREVVARIPATHTRGLTPHRLAFQVVDSDAIQERPDDGHLFAMAVGIRLETSTDVRMA